MWSGHEHGWGWGMGYGTVGMMLFWVLFVLGIVILVKWIAGSSAGPSSQAPERTALDILKERYARGEIQHGDFEKMKRDLAN